MNLKVTAENSQGIADVFEGWFENLEEEKCRLVIGHVENIKKINAGLQTSHGIGEQSRRVLLASIYIFYLEHFMEGRKIPKYADEITY